MKKLIMGVIVLACLAGIVRFGLSVAKEEKAMGASTKRCLDAAIEGAETDTVLVRAAAKSGAQ